MPSWRRRLRRIRDPTEPIARAGRAWLPGCVTLLVLWVVASAVLAVRSGWGWSVAAVPAVLVLIAIAQYHLRRRALLREVASSWLCRGIDCLVVHSDSPIWSDHIRAHWLPVLGERARTLNWSQRASWGRSLEVRVFEEFVRAAREFNPAVVVFRPDRPPLVYRFYGAFHLAKHGVTEALHDLEKSLFRVLEDDRADRPRDGAGLS